MLDPALRPVRFALVAALALGTAGCQAFQFGNPFLPKARLLATPEDKQVEVKIEQTSSGGWKQTVTPEAMKFSIQPYPGDITPGVRLNAYSVDWLDQNGVPISETVIPPRSQGLGLYLPKGTGGATAKTVEIMVVTNSVVEFGRTNGFVFDQTKNEYVPRTGDWPQYLTGRVVFSGRDDNGNPLENVQAIFPLRFTTVAAGTN